MLSFVWLAWMDYQCEMVRQKTKKSLKRSCKKRGKVLMLGLFVNYRVNSAPAGNHSILALSNDRQLVAAPLAYGELRPHFTIQASAIPLKLDLKMSI